MILCESFFQRSLFQRILSEKFLFFIIFSASSVLIFSSIGRHGFWLDEIFSIYQAKDINNALSSTGGNRLIYVIILHYWVKFGESESWIRSLSALFALGTIPVVYATFKRLVNGYVIVISTALFALNPFFLNYAQEARNYSLLLLFTSTSVLAFVSAVQTSLKRHWILFAIFGVLSVATHPMGMLIPLSLGISIILLPRPRPWGNFLLGFGCVLSTPLLLQIVFGSPEMRQLSWIPVPGIGQVKEFFKIFSGGTHWMAAVHLSLGSWALVSVAKAKSGTTSWERYFIVFWFAVPLLIALLASYIFQPMFVPRFLLFSLPAMSILAGIGLFCFNRKAVQLILTIFLIIIFINALSRFPWKKEQWREVSNSLVNLVHPGDAIIYHPHYISKPLDFYIEKSCSKDNYNIFQLKSVTTRTFDNRDEPDWTMINSLSKNHENVWFVVRNETHGNRRETVRRVVQELDVTYGQDHQLLFRGIRIIKFTRLENHG